MAIVRSNSPWSASLVGETVRHPCGANQMPKPGAPRRKQTVSHQPGWRRRHDSVNPAAA